MFTLTTLPVAALAYFTAGGIVAVAIGGLIRLIQKLGG
jgi:hypothetical protein